MFRSLRSLAILVLLAVAAFSADATQYAYDALGHVTRATEPDGSSVQYTYDASGNVTSITRASGSPAVAINSFFPTSGPAGTSITISGVGFSNITNQNTVTFNGLTAAVTHATANTLVARVPSGAATGTISVTTPMGSAASVIPFVATSVSITGLSPIVAPVGTLITVTGTGFDPVAAGNTIRFNTTTGAIQSASATQLTTTVPAGATSGRITVTTSAGSALSASDFIVPPPGHVAGDIALAGHLTPGGSGLIYTIGTANKLGAAFFDGVQGQRITMLLTNVSMGGVYKIYAPDGTLFASGNMSNNLVLDLAPLPATGTYSIYLAPGAAVGSATVKVVTDLTGAIATNGTPARLALSSGQNAILSFNGVPGQSFNLLLTDVTSAPPLASPGVLVLRPDGSTLSDCSNNAINNLCRFVLPAAGTYRVRLDPPDRHVMSFTVRLNEDFRGTLAIGTPLSVTLSGVGQQGLLNFTATTGQTFAVQVESIVTVPSGRAMFFNVDNAAGTQILTSGTGLPGNTLNLPDLAAGTYSVLIKPLNGAIATMQVTLVSGLTGTLPSSGTTSTFSSTVPGQNGYFTFAGTAGQNLSLAMTNLSLVPSSVNRAFFTVFRPNGVLINTVPDQAAVLPGAQMSLVNLPMTGTYRVFVEPDGRATMSFALTLSQNITGALAFDTPLDLTLDLPGRSATLSFTATAGQTIALNATSVATTPAGKTVRVTVFNAAGTQIASVGTSGRSLTVNLPNLSAGSYSALITTVDAATATMQVTIH